MGEASMLLEPGGSQSPAPLYLRIKRMISRRVLSGEWARDARIPSESELVRDLGISRMTVHRALRELTEEGMLVRLPGVGTFVAPAKPQSALLEIRNIADEIRDRGHEYSCDVHLLRAEPAPPDIAGVLNLAASATLFRSVCVHREGGAAVQLEDRYVSPVAAAGYLDQDFTRITPNEYLTRTAPATEAEHVIEATLPDEETQRLLEIGPHEPCLLLTRTTWSGTVPVTRARLTHPGSRYRLAGRFPVRYTS